MTNYTFTNCAARFVFVVNGSEDYPLITSDMDEMQKEFTNPVSSILKSGLAITIANTKYRITHVSIEFYNDLVKSQLMFEDHRGQLYDFNTEIWIYLDTI